jgi:hypothetical protein
MIDATRLDRLSGGRRRLLARRLAALSARAAPAARRLAAFVTPAGADPPAPEALRRHAAERLPAHAVPARFVVLPELPLTPAGKLDVEALRRLGAAAAERRAPALAPPDDALERAVAEVWREVLGVERAGADENFFDLGGHSLLLVRLQNGLREAVGGELEVMDLFRYPTVRLQAEAVRALGAGERARPGSHDDARERAGRQREAMRRLARETNGGDTHE